MTAGPHDYSGHVPENWNVGEPEERPQDEESKEIPPHSHILTLADGTTHYYDAADGEPNGPVPSHINDVPVVSVTHAYERAHDE